MSPNLSPKYSNHHLFKLVFWSIATAIALVLLGNTPEKVAGQTQSLLSYQHSTGLTAQQLTVEKSNNLPVNETTSSLDNWRNLGLIALGIAMLVIVFVYYKKNYSRPSSPQFSKKHIPYKHVDVKVEQLRYILWDLLQGIDQSTTLDRAKRLVTHIHKNHADKTEKWCLEKALEDIIRDRKITGLAHIVKRYKKRQIIQESFILPVQEEINYTKIVNSQKKSTEVITISPSAKLIEEILSGIKSEQYQTENAIKNKLISSIEPGNEEEFQESLKKRIASIEKRIAKNKYDERKIIQLEKQLKNVRLLQKITTQWQKSRTNTEKVSQLLQDIINNPEEQILIFAKALESHTLEEIRLLSELLKKESVDRLQSFDVGLSRGLNLISTLQPYLTNWIKYKDVLASNITIGGTTSERITDKGSFFEYQSPWKLWSEKINSPWNALFVNQEYDKSAEEFSQCSEIDISEWVELILVIKYLPLLLIKWLDRQVFDSKSGKILANRTLISFAIICCELAQGLKTAKTQILDNSKQLEQVFMTMTWQLLETLSKREEIPLYNGVTISLSGNILRDNIDYINEYLKNLPSTQCKGNLLTLLSHYYSLQGKYTVGNNCSQEALDIAQINEDENSEIANLNYLFHNSIGQENYDGAIQYSLDILDKSRQSGKLLEASNGLINLGYTKILKAQKIEENQAIIEEGIKHISEGLDILENSNYGDYKYWISLPLKIRCYNYVGKSYLVLEEPELALEYLEKSREICEREDDLYLRGLNFTYLGEAHFHLKKLEEALLNSCLGRYYLNKIQSPELRQSEELIKRLKNVMRTEEFEKIITSVENPDKHSGNNPGKDVNLPGFGFSFE
ncbi:MAG: hypothetical protein QNJ51_15580 [Calothrix sp. MO_167.B12]|nr:hypothetical protein [Calothrix sp. MO_167.B12]